MSTVLQLMPTIQLLAKSTVVRVQEDNTPIIQGISGRY
jgi:hypothetical protein